MKIYSLIFSLILFFVDPGITEAQNSQQKLIKGCWHLDRIQPGEGDSLYIPDGPQDITLCFDNAGKFSTSSKQNGKEVLLGNGKYSISANGKTIYQDQQEGEVIILVSQQLAIKTPEGSVMYFHKINR